SLGSLTPGLGHHASETAVRGRDLEDAPALGKRVVHVIDLACEQIGLIKGGVRGSLYYSENYSLVLSRRQFALREHVERHDQQDNNRPDCKHNGPVLECSGQRSRIGATHALEAAVDPSCEATVGIYGA